MSSWWRKFAEQIGAPASHRSWRQIVLDFTGLTREDLSPGSGGWDRRIVTHYDRIPGTGPWARHLGDGEIVPPDEVENGVIHNGDPVFFEGNRVVHNG